MWLAPTSRPILIATALLALAIGLFVFYETVPALNGGSQFGQAEWHTEPPIPLTTCSDRFGNMAVADNERNTIVVQFPCEGPRKLSEVPGMREARGHDGRWAIMLPDGSTAQEGTLTLTTSGETVATLPAPIGLVKQFAAAAETANVEQFKITDTLLGLVRDPETHRQLAESIARYAKPHD